MTNIFRRINDILNANLNDLLDRIEDPERMIKQIIREMEDNISRCREDVINAVASEKQLFRELEQQRGLMEHWRERAEHALEQDREELARTALTRKKEIQRTVDSLQAAWESARDNSERLKEQLRKLEEKLEEARRKRSTLLARQRAAEARQRMDQTHRHFERGLDARTRFERMEDRVLEIETRAEALADLDEANSTLEKTFERMEVDSEVEAELCQLKARVR